MKTAATTQWPASDFTRVPFRVFMDENIEQLEQEARAISATQAKE